MSIGTEKFNTQHERKCVRSPHKKESKLKELIIVLKAEYNISLRKISEKLRMGRETIRKIYLE